MTGLPKHSDSPAEPRQSQRVRTFLGGKLVLRDGSATISCTIRNRSRTGAKIEIAAAQPIPLRFYLLIPKDRLAFDAETMWRRGNLAGLRLHHIVDTAASSEPLMKRLGNIMAEWPPQVI